MGQQKTRAPEFYTLLETNIAPENQWLEAEIFLWDGLFSGTMLVSGSVEFFFEARTCTPRIYIHKNGGGSLVPALNSQWDLNILETNKNIQENPSSSTNLSL